MRKGFHSCYIMLNLVIEVYKFVNFVGVTSNTDAAQLAETFAEAKCPTKVIYSDI